MVQAGDSASWLETGTPAVRVVMDTHSVDLDGFDLATLARVRIDGGPWIAPSAWDAPKGGHHREGTLTFAAMDRASLDTAKLIELEMRDVAVPSPATLQRRKQFRGNVLAFPDLLAAAAIGAVRHLRTSVISHILRDSVQHPNGTWSRQNQEGLLSG